MIATSSQERGVESPWSHVLLAFVASFMTLSTPSEAQLQPQDAFDEVFGLFHSHDGVLFGEQHHGRLNYEFRLESLRSPGFADVVQDPDGAGRKDEPFIDPDYIERPADLPA